MEFTTTCPFCYEEFETLEDVNGECPKCKEKYEWGWDGDYGGDSVWIPFWVKLKY
jgi:hypothetical protein